MKAPETCPDTCPHLSAQLCHISASDCSHACPADPPEVRRLLPILKAQDEAEEERRVRGRQ